MSDFTPGKWLVAPFDVIGDAIYAPVQTESRRNEVVAFGITNKSDARLIAAAPEMYELLKDYNADPAEQIAWLIRRHNLLARIDGKDVSHE